MNSAQQFEPLLAILHTTDDVERLSEGLDSLLASLYKTDGKSLTDKLASSLPSHAQEAIHKILSEKAIDSQNIEEFKGLVTSLKNTLGHVNTVSLSLACDPPQKTIQAVSDWIKHAFGPETVMEISIQPHILGGAIIVTNGRYVDKSLKRKLDILFEVKRSEIEQMLLNMNEQKE